MTKSRKVALWSIAAVALTLALGAMLLHAITDEARLKEMVQNHVRKTWGRELSVGKLSLTLTPMPALHAADVTLSSPEWAQDKALLEARHITVGLKLLPLLGGRVAIDNLTLAGFAINLQQDPDGRKSWAITTGIGPAAQTAGPAYANMQIKQLDLRHGNIRYRNAANQVSEWQVENAHAAAADGLRAVTMRAVVSHDGNVLHAKATLDDLSQLGVAGASTNGMIKLEAGPATMQIKGRLPLDAQRDNFAVDIAVDGTSLDQGLGFFDIAHRLRAPFRASGKIQAEHGAIKASAIQLQLGQVTMNGEVNIVRRGTTPIFDATLHADRIDWVQARHDAGLAPLPPKPKNELFYDNPLPWSLLAATRGMEGVVRTRIQFLKLRSGTELTDVRSDLQFADGHLTLPAFRANLLGGTASGTAVMDGARQSAQVELHLKDTLLGNWLAQTRKKARLTGGPVQLHASVTARGASMKKLAASLTGPVTIQVGKAALLSQKLGEAEALFVGLLPYLSARDSSQVELRCVGARLPFVQGVTQGTDFIGTRSEASQILVSGTVDLRRQALDLHGPVRARSGITLGVANFANELKIEGPITGPTVGLDKAAAPGALARVAAAILTGGVSMIGTAIWDGAQAVPNPCDVALAGSAIPASRKIKSTGSRAANTARNGSATR